MFWVGVPKVPQARGGLCSVAQCGATLTVRCVVQRETEREREGSQGAECTLYCTELWVTHPIDGSAVESGGQEEERLRNVTAIRDGAAKAPSAAAAGESSWICPGYSRHLSPHHPRHQRLSPKTCWDVIRHWRMTHRNAVWYPSSSFVRLLVFVCWFILSFKMCFSICLPLFSTPCSEGWLSSCQNRKCVLLWNRCFIKQYA